MTTSYLSSIKTTMTAVNTYMRLIASTRDAARKADYETKLAAIMKNVESYVADIARLNPGKDVNAILAAAGITLPNGTAVPAPTPVVTTPPTSVNTNTIAGINSASGFTLTQNITYPTASAEDISAKTLAAIKFGTSGGYSFTESQGVR
jgi:phosphoribosylcarboxyaminoimidazole (NCAIR) mutase